MTRFVDALRETSARLSLPQPAKARVLLELAADMEDLFEAHCRAGMTPFEAHQRVLEQLRLSDDAVAALNELHNGGARRFLRGLSVAARSGVEVGFLSGLLLFVVALVAGQAVSDGLLAQATPLAWPAVAMALLGVGVGAWRGYTLWVAQSHHLRELRRGLRPMLALASCSVAFALVVPVLEAWSITAAAAVEPVDAALLTNWLTAAAATVVVSLMCALFCSMVWFGLARKVARVEQAEMSYVLQS